MKNKIWSLAFVPAQSLLWFHHDHPGFSLRWAKAVPFLKPFVWCIQNDQGPAPGHHCYIPDKNKFKFSINKSFFYVAYFVGNLLWEALCSGSLRHGAMGTPGSEIFTDLTTLDFYGIFYCPLQEYWVRVTPVYPAHTCLLINRWVGGHDSGSSYAANSLGDIDNADHSVHLS